MSNHVVKMLELSTAHLSPATRDLIEMETDDIPAFYAKDMHGWFFPVLQRDLWPHTIPDDLKGVLIYAESLGLSGTGWIMFDGDCDEVDELPTYLDNNEKVGAAAWRKAAEEEDAGLGDELADVSVLSEHEARALPGGLPPADCPSCGGKMGAYHVFGCPRANDPIADLAEIVSPNISEAKRTYRKPEFRYVGKHMAWDRSPIEELRLAAMDIMMEIDSEIEQRQNSGNDEEWDDLKRKNERLEKALAAL